MIDDTSFSGYLAVRRNLLAHVQDGRLKPREFCVYMYLLLDANYKTGELKTSPKVLVKILPGFLNDRAMQRVFEQLEKKGYITRFIEKGRAGIYKLAITKYEKHAENAKETCPVNGAKPASKKAKNVGTTYGSTPGSTCASELVAPVVAPDIAQSAEATDSYEDLENEVGSTPGSTCGSTPAHELVALPHPIQKEITKKGEEDLTRSDLAVPAAGENVPVRGVPPPVKANVPSSLNALVAKNNPPPKSAKPFAPTQSAQSAGPQYSDAAHELAEFWAKMEGSYDTANLDFYAKCCEIALETVPDPNDLRRLMKFAWENDSYIREECDVPIALFKTEKKLRETAYKFGRSQTKESKAASVEHLSWVKAAKEGFDEDEA